MRIRISTVVLTVIFLWIWHYEDYNPWSICAFGFYLFMREAGNAAREKIMEEKAEKELSESERQKGLTE